jgi:hypothetical protein
MDRREQLRYGGRLGEVVRLQRPDSRKTVQRSWWERERRGRVLVVARRREKHDPRARVGAVEPLVGVRQGAGRRCEPGLQPKEKGGG